MGENAIVRIYGELDSVTSIEDENGVIRVLSQLAAVKDALDMADAFRERSVEFARYEAYALVRAVEICGDTHLIKGKWRKLAAEWLVSLGDDERLSAIEMCVDGMTIDNVYKKQVAEPQLKDELASAVSECKNEAREELRKNGVVNISKIVSKQSNKFPRSMRHDITDGVRNAVRKAGGVGVGDDTTTYIDPDRATPRVADAIACKIQAVAIDIESIADLAQRSVSKPSFVIRGDGNSLGFCDVTYLILAGIGCASVSFENAKAKKNAVSVIRQIVGDIR